MHAVVKLVFLAILASAPLGYSLAASQYPLFEVSVPVSSRDDQQRLAGIAQAMRTVVNRLVAAGSNAGQALLQDSSRYVTEYRYSFQPAPDPDSSDGQQLLAVSFDANAILQKLRAEGVPLWDGVRPDILLWLAQEDRDGKRHMLSPELEPGLADALRAAAGQKGLNLMLPLMDLSDNMSMSVDDVISQDEQTIVNASGRYNAPVVTSGFIRQVAPDEWRGRWFLLDKGPEGYWEGSYDTRQQALEGLMTGIYARLFADYASMPPEDDTAETMQLVVTGLATMADFSRAADYLASLGLVLDVAWQSLDKQTATFVLKLRASPEMLKRNLELDGQLMLVDRFVSPPRYRLIR